MVSTEGVTSCVLEAVLSHLLLSCALLFAAVAAICWYIRDSRTVDGLGRKCVFITGCDSGFGNLLARRLDRKGVRVIAACLTEEGAAALAAAASPALRTLLLDVTDSRRVARAAQVVRAEVGERGLWGLVNNAGRAVPIGPTEWMQKEDFDRVLDVNLVGVIDVTLRLLPLLKRARGRVVNVASVLGRLSLVGGGYCLSKWGVEAFSDSLRYQAGCSRVHPRICLTGCRLLPLPRRDMHHFGIKVSIIEPGFFKTAVTRLDLIEADLKRLWTRLPAHVRDSYGATYCDDYIKSQEFSMNLLCSSDLSKVTGCMEHALTARFPRTRYGAGWDAKLLWIPLSYLPSFVSDRFTSALLPSYGHK
ncbi:retinol dehydrogenase 1 isoform X1 [Betta splendens]|uniref:Retinol dehydrogenase 1 isoform X1 n=1 Tax=Betta splendens TaxID=158456 RepID=A0A6P7LH09_BETSP|nr:retinol dehydrogenase 1 isoform X1 [Betta splendens]